jgi:hypothetical protein
MKTYGKTIDLAILDRVLTEYPSAKDMPVGDDTPGKLYKSIDSRTGNIYLIVNPATWRTRREPDGTVTRFRPKPIHKMTYDEAIEAARNATAAAQKAAKQERVI